MVILLYYVQLSFIYVRLTVYYFPLLDISTLVIFSRCDTWISTCIYETAYTSYTLYTPYIKINIWRFCKLHWIRELSFSWPSRAWLFCFPIRTHERNHKHILIHQAAATILGQKWYRQVKAKCSRSETISLYGPGFLSSQRHTECKEYRFFCWVSTPINTPRRATTGEPKERKHTFRKLQNAGKKVRQEIPTL